MKKIIAYVLIVLITFTVSPVNVFAAGVTIDGNGIYDIGDYGNDSTITIAPGLTVTLTNNAGTTYTNMKIDCGAGTILTIDSVKINNYINDNACALAFTGSGNQLFLQGDSNLHSSDYEPGIRVEDSTELEILGAGSVTARGSGGGAGIGGGYNSNGGSITITSGTVTAYAGADSAGIGGGLSGSGGTITISGGTVTANGPTSVGCGIGGSAGGGSGVISITGGTVNATAGQDGAGIGGFGDRAGDSITISGGTVTATGGRYYGAGIGGAFGCDGGEITISGGIITAVGGEHAAGIGGGSGGSAGAILIDGGIVYAQKGDTAPYDIGDGEGGTGGTLGISEDSAVVLKNGDCITPTTAHTLVTFNTVTDDQVYGIELPNSWGAPVYAYFNESYLYDLIYDANGGTGTVPDKETQYVNTTVSVADGSDLTNGSEFYNHWNTSSSGLGTRYMPEDEYTFIQDYTLYAIYDTATSVAGVTLSKSEIDVMVGDSDWLIALVDPEESSNQTVTWSSADENIAIVADGIVSGIGLGSTTITATTVDGGFTASCEVDVIPYQSYNASDNLGFTPLDMALDPDRPVAYLTEQDGYRLYRVDLTTGEISSIVFPYKAERLAVGHGNVYVTLLHDEHKFYIPDGEGTGSCAIIDTGTYQINKIFDVPHDPYDIVTDNGGRVYIGPGSNQHSLLTVYNGEDGTQVSEWFSVYYLSELCYNRVYEKLYSIRPYINPMDIDAYEIENGTIISSYSSPYHGDYEMSALIQVSPDGQCIFNGSGNIFTSSAERGEDLRYDGNIGDAFTSICFDLNNDQFFTCEQNKNALRVYNYTTRELEYEYIATDDFINIFHDGTGLITLQKSNLSKYYINTFNRQDIADMESQNTNLSYIYADGAVLEPGFNEDILDYSLILDSDQASVTVTCAAADSEASVTMDGMTTQSKIVNVNKGEAFTLYIEVTSSDGLASKIYSVRIYRMNDEKTLALDAEYVSICNKITFPSSSNLYFMGENQDFIYKFNGVDGSLVSKHLDGNPHVLATAYDKLILTLEDYQNNQHSIILLDPDTLEITDTIDVDARFTKITGDSNYIFGHCDDVVEVYSIQTHEKLAERYIRDNVRYMGVNPVQGGLYLIDWYNDIESYQYADGQLTYKSAFDGYNCRSFNIMPDGHHLILDNGYLLTCSTEADNDLKSVVNIGTTASPVVLDNENEFLTFQESVVYVYDASDLSFKRTYAEQQDVEEMHFGGGYVFSVHEKEDEDIVIQAYISNALLESIHINSDTITEFYPTSFDIDWGEAPYSTSSVDIKAQPLLDGAVVTGDIGIQSLNLGENEFTITVTEPIIGRSESYTINIYRRDSDPPVVNVFDTLDFVPGDMLLDPDRQVAYLTEEYGTKVYRIDLLTGEAQYKHFDIQAQDMSIKNGKLYVSLRRRYYSSYTTGYGAVAIIDTSTFTVEKIFNIPCQPNDLEVNGGIMYFASRVSHNHALSVYDGNNGEQLNEWLLSSAHVVKQNPVYDKMYVQGSDWNNTKIMTAFEISSGELVDAYETPEIYGMTSYYSVSPDGQYVFNGGGKVFACAPTETGDMELVDTLGSAFVSICFNMDDNAFYTANDNVLSVYDYDSRELMYQYISPDEFIDIHFDDGKLIALQKNGAGEYFVRVAEITLVSRVQFDKETIDLTVGESVKLTATVEPPDATNKTVEWQSSDETVATVTDGVVTGVKGGTATITAWTVDGGFTDTCDVTVTESVSGVSLNKEATRLPVGDTETLVATVIRDSATNHNVSWSSDNEAVATVEDGVVTALSLGSAEITVTSEDGGYTDTCSVTVTVPFERGKGTLEEPYGISTPAQLNEVRYYPNAHFIMLNDIDMTTATSEGGVYYNDGAGWAPISRLCGSFNGNGYKIIGLNITRLGVGLEGNLAAFIYKLEDSATLKNVGIVNGEIIGIHAGGLVATNYGTILNSYNTCKVSTNGFRSSSGGIAAENRGVIARCYNSGEVEGNTSTCYVGGIAGKNHYLISDCYNIGFIQAGSDYKIGGIAGVSYRTSSSAPASRIEHCYNVGNLSASSPGGIVGLPGPDPDSIIDSYYIDTAENAYGLVFEGMKIKNTLKLSSEQMKQQDNFDGFDFTNVWEVVEGVRFPILKDVPFEYVTALTLDKSSLSLNTDGSETLIATISPEYASNINLIWSSDNESVATVSGGLITAIGKGDATITVTTVDGGFVKTCGVTVTQPVIGVSLDREILDMIVGDIDTLTASIEPSNASNNKITWSTSNSNIATVSNGIVTAKSAGTATITVTTEDGGHTDACVVTVTQTTSGVQLNKSSINLLVGDNDTLTATVLPSNAVNKNVTWSTSRASVATVSNGKIKAVSAGTATITVTTKDGGYIDTCTVTVGMPSVRYQTHVQDVGWQGWRNDGKTAGTSGRSLRLEGMYIEVVGIDNAIEYRTHVQDIGWQDWVSDGDMTGTSGRSLRLEAIDIRLTGEMAKLYDVYYRVHAQNVGWMDWAKNGQSSGTAGFSYRLEAIEIVLVEKGGAAPGPTMTPFKDVNDPNATNPTKPAEPTDPEPPSTDESIRYQTHVQNVGWQGWKYDGESAGTSGRSLRLEGMYIEVVGQDNAIEYRTHVQDIGWQDWVSDGEMTGTSGRSLRLEAIDIRLTGEMAKLYDVYYRVHAQNVGWMDWAKNGQSAGTAGFSYRLEAIQIALVDKGGAAPGSTARPFISANVH